MAGQIAHTPRRNNPNPCKERHRQGMKHSLFGALAAVRYDPLCLLAALQYHSCAAGAIKV